MNQHDRLDPLMTTGQLLHGEKAAAGILGSSLASSASHQPKYADLMVPEVSRC
jgi:hypothetical protein